MVAFALDLAGTKNKPLARLGRESVPVPETQHELEQGNLPIRPGPRGHERIWTTTVRPGPHDLLSWEEAMRVPWIDGTTDDKS